MLRKLLALLSLVVALNAHAAISFVGAGTPGTATGTSVTVAYPAETINANDLLTVHCFSSGATSPSSTGYTTFGELVGTSANQEPLWKRAAGGESGSITVSQSGSALKVCVMLVYRGVLDAGTPYEGLSSATAADATTACPDVTTTAANRVVVCLTSKDIFETTPTTPGTWNERVNFLTTSSTDATIHDFDQDVPTATTVTGPDVSYGVDTNEWFAHAFALIPQDAGGGGGLVVNPISGRGGAAAQPVVH